MSEIVVTHDVRSAFPTADRVALLEAGRLVFVGTPAEMKGSGNEYVREFLRGAVL